MAILTWDGRDVPDELRSLPPGKYVIERIDEVPQLTDAELDGLIAYFSTMKGLKYDVTPTP